jgi:hypothetical protein
MPPFVLPMIGTMTLNLGLRDGFWHSPQCRMPDYAACIVGTRSRRQFEGDLHRVVLIFRGIFRSFKGLAEMTATDRLA